MDTNSPTSLAPVAAKSSLLRGITLGLGLAFAAPVTAQNLDLQITDGIHWWTQDLTPDQDYLVMLGSCDPAFSGGWYGPMAFAYQETSTTNYPLVTTPIETVFQSLTGLTAANSSVVDSDVDTLRNFLKASLFTAGTAQMSENAVQSFIDPVFLPQGTNAQGAPWVEQLFGVNMGFPWLRDPSLQYIFNAQALLRQAVWARVSGTTSMTRHDFFNTPDAGFDLMKAEGITLAISLIGLRGPSAGGGDPFGTPNVPGLVGFPTSGAPQLAVSPAARIRFGGSTSPNGSGLSFRPFWNVGGNVPPQNLLTIGAAGAGWTSPAVGHDAGMQVRLFQNGAPGVNYALDLLEVDWGIVGFRIPPQCASGMHSVRQYRYYIGQLNNQPFYGPWMTIPQGMRALIAIQ